MSDLCFISFSFQYHIVPLVRVFFLFCLLFVSRTLALASPRCVWGLPAEAPPAAVRLGEKQCAGGGRLAEDSGLQAPQALSALWTGSSAVFAAHQPCHQPEGADPVGMWARGFLRRPVTKPPSRCCSALAQLRKQQPIPEVLLRQPVGGSVYSGRSGMGSAALKRSRGKGAWEVEPPFLLCPGKPGSEVCGEGTREACGT